MKTIIKSLLTLFIIMASTNSNAILSENITMDTIKQNIKIAGIITATSCGIATALTSYKHYKAHNSNRYQKQYKKKMIQQSIISACCFAGAVSLIKSIKKE